MKRKTKTNCSGIPVVGTESKNIRLKQNKENGQQTAALNIERNR